MNSIQSILNKQGNQENNTIPTIAIQNNLTINQSEELSKDSRDRIKDVIQAILKQQNQIIENNVTNEGGTEIV